MSNQTIQEQAAAEWTASIVSRVTEYESYRESEGRAILNLLYENPTVAIALDTETTGLQVYDDRDCCIGVSIAAVLEDGTPVKHYFANDHPLGKNISDRTFDMLRYVLEQDGRPLVFANVQFDVASLMTVGIDVIDQDFWDIMTMAQLVNENAPRRKTVENLSLEYLKEQAKIVEDKFINSEKKTGWRNTTPKMMWDYAVADAVAHWRVWDKLIQHPEWTMLPDDIWTEKAKLIRVLVKMRRRGILLDQKVARQEEEIGSAEMERLKAELGMNPASNDQMKTLFIDTLGFPVLKKSEKTGKPSFDKSVMPEYELMLDRMDRKEAVLIKSYRGWQKSVTASYRPYLKLVSPDGRLRCEYTTHVTATGRLSSRDPNLQQISKDGGQPWNKNVKKCFIAKPGYVLLSADYSQLELRLGAAYADEQALKKVFNEGRDIFDEMAAMLGMARPDTKTLTYSLQYGAGEGRIMAAFGVTKQKARQLIDNYWSTYPRFGMLNENVKQKVEQTKRIKIWSGRTRHFQYTSESYKALNSLIQGGAADIVERVMVRAYEELDNPECRLLLQVHDALVFEVKEDLADDYAFLIKELMEDVEGIIPERIEGAFNVKFAVQVEQW